MGTRFWSVRIADTWSLTTKNFPIFCFLARLRLWLALGSALLVGLDAYLNGSSGTANVRREKRALSSRVHVLSENMCRL
jgi:hypothetical protein